MAKQKENVSEPGENVREDIRDMAARLYERNWQPSGSIEPTAFAAMCYRGAQQFYRVASRVTEGQSPDEIIAKPE